MKLQYKEFSQNSISEKIINIEDFFEFVNFNEITEKELRLFFRNIIENETDNYLRKISLETLCVLSCFDKVRSSALLEIMLDIGENDDPFVILTALRYLPFFNDDDHQVLQKIESNKYSSNEDVSSEAYFRHGIINFFQSTYSSDIDFLDNLNVSKRLFSSSLTIENRVDAKFYLSIIDFIENVLNRSEEEVNLSFNKVTENLWNYSLGFIDESKLGFEHKIYKVLCSLKNITTTVNKHESWTDFYKEFKKLSQFNYEFQCQEIKNNRFFIKYLNSLKENMNIKIIEPVVFDNLQYHKLRIENMLNEYNEDFELVQFLQELKIILSLKYS